MKRILIDIVVIATALLLASSCEDWSFLKENPKAVSLGNFLQNSTTIEAEVNSIYYQLERGEAFGRYLSVLSESIRLLLW